MSENLPEFGRNISVVWEGQGWGCSLSFMGRTMKCSLGKNGVSVSKREGDGCTPAGSFPLRRAFFRTDKITKEQAQSLPDFLTPLASDPTFGWIDEPTSTRYNEFAILPIEESHENLYLADSNVYDVLAVVGYNDDPVVPYMGSAIFFHVTVSYGPTAGCVALAVEDLLWVLSQVQPDTVMTIT